MKRLAEYVTRIVLGQVCGSRSSRRGDHGAGAANFVRTRNVRRRSKKAASISRRPAGQRARSPAGNRITSASPRPSSEAAPSPRKNSIQSAFGLNQADGPCRPRSSKRWVLRDARRISFDRSGVSSQTDKKIRQSLSIWLIPPGCSVGLVNARNPIAPHHHLRLGERRAIPEKPHRLEPQIRLGRDARLADLCCVYLQARGRN